MAQRLDLYLYQAGLAKSRSHAQALIREGSVRVKIQGQFQTITKPSFEISDSAEVQLADSQVSKFVSRGGLKLEAALKELQLSVEGFEVLDLGISTGGFTDCLLQKGAQRVVGLDVGHGQLDPKLLKDPRVELHEGVNARDFSLPWTFDLIVADLSFISLTLVLPGLPRYLKPNGLILALVKPQFELSAKSLSKKGIVKDESEFEAVRQRIEDCCRQSGLTVVKYFACAIKGADGNQEFFSAVQKGAI